MIRTQPLNLLPNSLIVRRAKRRYIRVWAAASILYTTLVVFAGVATRYLGEPDSRQLDSQLAKVTLDAAQVSEIVQGQRAESARMPSRLALAQVLADCPDWSILLRALAHERGSDLTLNEIQVDSKPSAASEADVKLIEVANARVFVNGQAKSQQDVTGFTLRLQQLGCFSTVQIVRSGRDQGDAGGIAFQLECALGESGGPQ